MTKQDFELLADCIRKELPWRCTVVEVAKHLAKAIGEKHPRFDAERFLERALRDPI